MIEELSKKCSRCNKVFDMSAFKFNERKQTFYKQCITCQEKQMKYVMNHYNKNKDNENYREKKLEYRQKYRQTDAHKQYVEERKQNEAVQERKRIVNREWRKNNIEKVQEQTRKSNKIFYEKNGHTEEYKERRRMNRSKPEIKNKIKEYNKKTETINKIKEYNKKTETKKRRNERQSKRRKEDPLVALRDNLSRCINKALHSHGSRKSDRTVKYLGCSISEFVEHMESQFQEGMTWTNYGRRNMDENLWEIDHIVPIHYGCPDIEEVKNRLHYTNCQPMWAVENSAKSNRFIGRLTE
jgi:hypothetical protein